MKYCIRKWYIELERDGIESINSKTKNNSCLLNFLVANDRDMEKIQKVLCGFGYMRNFSLSSNFSTNRSIRLALAGWRWLALYLVFGEGKI